MIIFFVDCMVVFYYVQQCCCCIYSVVLWVIFVVLLVVGFDMVDSCNVGSFVGGLFKVFDYFVVLIFEVW